MINFLKGSSISINYFIFNYEIGDTGNLHSHLYVELKQQCRFSKIKKIFPGAHIEKRYGTQESAIDYVYKRGKFEDKFHTLKEGQFEWGTKKHQGNRNDLNDIKRMFDQGDKFYDIVKQDENFAVCIKHWNSLLKFERISQTSRDFKSKVIVIYGRKIKSC